jgi:anti-sigma regulatory factor (Ser/Thr protein kinase)
MTGIIDREQRTFDAEPTSAHGARQFVAELLEQHGASTESVADCVLVASELVSNVLEHSDGTPFEIALDTTDPQWWAVEVTSAAMNLSRSLLDPDTWTVAAAEQVSGRGLGIVRRLMDDVITDVTDGRLTVRCRRRRTPEG